MLTTVAGSTSLLIWAYLLLARGGFWRITSTGPECVSREIEGPIAVIVPARNEAGVVGKSISSLLNQTCIKSLHIFLVNDGSTDSTAEIARRTVASAGKAAALTVIEGHPLPEGWSGKVWAMHQGVESSRKVNPRFLLFTDADIVHEPESISTLTSLAEAGHYDLASYMVKLHCETLAERFLVPAFVFFFFKLYPPSWIADRRRRNAGAAGGCILIRPEALERSGDLASIHGEIIDDCALARQVKGS